MATLVYQENPCKIETLGCVVARFLLRITLKVHVY